MPANEPVSLITPASRVVADPTPGMVREQAIVTDGLWVGAVKTEPKMASDWHHHGAYQTSIYVVSGRLRMESGSGGASVVEAQAGDFLFVAPGAIHRETNPEDEPGHLVVLRVGHGVPTVNVEGPAPA